MSLLDLIVTVDSYPYDVDLFKPQNLIVVTYSKSNGHALFSFLSPSWATVPCPNRGGAIAAPPGPNAPASQNSKPKSNMHYPIRR